MSSPSSSKLFQPIRVGRLNLQHRIVYPPQTRYKATRNGHVPLLPLVKDYYSQRASTPGTLIITEAVLVSDKAGGKAHLPGIWNQEQIEAWKAVSELELDMKKSKAQSFGIRLLLFFVDM